MQTEKLDTSEESIGNCGVAVQDEENESRLFAQVCEPEKSGFDADQSWAKNIETQSLAPVKASRWAVDLSRLSKRSLSRLFGWSTFRTSYWSLYRPLKTTSDRIFLISGIILAVAAGVPLPIIGVIFGHLINTFPPPENELTPTIEKLIGVACAYFVVTWGWSICWGIVGERVSRSFRESMVERILGMDMEFFDVEAPHLSSMLSHDTQLIQGGTSEKVGLFIQSISYFVAAFVVGFILNAKLTGILFAAIIPAMTINVIVGTTMVSKFSKRSSELAETAMKIAESAIDAVQLVQAFGAIDILADKHAQILYRASKAGFRKSLSGAVMYGIVFFIAYAANALAFWEGSKLTKGGGVGTVYAVVFLILDASFVVGNFGPFIQSFALAASSGSKVLDLIDRPEATINVRSKEGVSLDDQTLEEDVVFSDVEFSYPARVEAPVLKRVNLTFKAGAMNAVVGLSGSGKSTIATLLLRFYNPTSGRIMLGGRNIDEFNIKSLRGRIGLVDQDPVLFSGTILQNIGHGIHNKYELTNEEIYERCTTAATQANAEFIGGLPMGIHTRVGGSGAAQLSGGQKQRICLARALVRRPNLLILDEPTSALDAVSETLILQAVRDVSTSGCTVITVAHRLATIRDANNIIVMAHGQVLESGNHDELVATGGVYKGLVDAQKLETSATSPRRRSQMGSTATETLANLDISFEPGLDDLEPQRPKHPTRKTSSRSTVALLNRCLHINKPELPLILLGLLSSVVSGGLIIGESEIWGHLVNLLHTQSSSSDFRSRVDFFSLMFFVLAIIALFAYSLSGTIFGLASERLVNRVKDISLRTILKQDLACFSKGQGEHSTHALIASMAKDSGHLGGMSGVIIGTIISVFTSIAGGIILAHIVAWKIAIVLLAAVPIMIVAGFFRLRVLAKAEERQATAYNEAAALASEACAGIRTVAAFSREEDIMREYRAAVERPYKESFKFIVLGNLMLAFSLAITYFVYSLAYWWGSKQVRNGTYDETQFFVVLPALLFSAQSSGQLFSLAPEVTRAKAAAQHVFRLHDQKPTIMTDEVHGCNVNVSGNKSDFTSEASSLESAALSRGKIEFRSVCFAYPSRPMVTVLKDINFTINPGEFIGIVGPSGAGKSSLMSLLERFYDPTSGSILVDGVDIKTIPIHMHRVRIGLVAQEPDLFPGSITFNVGIGAKPGTTPAQEDVERVCKLAGLHSFVTSLPEGYDTDCGRNGSQLSGGQKQRLAVVRALLRDPEILLLDEATASLDSHSEKEVQNAIAAASGRDDCSTGTRGMKRTTIVVAHRLSTVQKADRILVFDGGKVVESGTHDELMEMGGVYAGMVLAQEIG